MSRNNGLERHRRPMAGGIISNRLLIGILAALALWLGSFIGQLLPPIGAVIMFISIIVLTFTLYPWIEKKLKPATDINSALIDIHKYWYSQNIITNDIRDINYYYSPITRYYNGIIKVYCIPERRKAMLDESTIQGLETYLNQHNVNVRILSAKYHSDGFINYKLGKTIEEDRISFE